MDLHKAFDCAVGTCTAIWGVWLGEHWMTVLGGALLVYRGMQVVLEALGYDVRPGWLRRLFARMAG